VPDYVDSFFLSYHGRDVTIRPYHDNGTNISPLPNHHRSPLSPASPENDRGKSYPRPKMGKLVGPSGQAMG
jgi:hypothetical protein